MHNGINYISSFIPEWQPGSYTWELFINTLLMSDVTRRDHVSIVMDAGSRSQFHSQFHSRWYSLRITLQYTTLVHMYAQ